MLELASLSRDELVAKVLELESVLTEFQESSRELELALEDELVNLEEKVSTLESRCTALDAQAAKDRLRAQDLTQELEAAYERHREKSSEWDQSRSRLMQQLVQVEIANDTMENKDRARQTQLSTNHQLVNELLEKLAMVEHDLELERANSASNKLYTANYQNEVRELTEKLSAMEKLSGSSRDLPQNDSCDGDILVVSMRQVLLAGPPTPHVLARNYPRLPSLQKLHELHRGVSLYMTRSGLIASESPTTTVSRARARSHPSPGLLPPSATSSRDSPSKLLLLANNTAAKPLHTTQRSSSNDNAIPESQLKLEQLASTSKSNKKRTKRRLLELPPFRVPGRRTRSDASQ